MVSIAINCCIWRDSLQYLCWTTIGEVEAPIGGSRIWQVFRTLASKLQMVVSSYTQDALPTPRLHPAPAGHEHNTTWRDERLGSCLISVSCGRANICTRFSQQVLLDTTPMPADIPAVKEIGASSAPLLSAAYFIGARCRPYNDDYMQCKTEAYGRGELDCLKEGRKVTRCATSVYVINARTFGPND